MHTPTQIQRNTPHYIDGHWQTSLGDTFASHNPIDNTPLWVGNAATDLEVSMAFETARRALPSWSALSFEARVLHIQLFGRAVEEKRQELCHLISLEAGKPLWESMTEVTAVINKIQLSIQAYQERTREEQTSTTTLTTATRYKPHGVIAVLGPFNFPAHLSNGHIVPALLAGNTIVYKPSELTPKIAECIIQCWHDSGLPKGVINCIQGGASVAQALLKKDIQAVYFTGSYQTGLHIHRTFSDRPNVLLALEMGGNNPLIIDNIDDIDAAVYQSVLSTFITAGQRCTCARRMMIANNHSGDAFLKRYLEVTKNLRIGPFTLRPEPFMGPVIRHDHAIRHLKAQQSLIDNGGRALLQMRLLQDNSGLLSPGIIDMSGVSNPIDEEIFAPLVQIYRYSHFSDAINLANQTRYGLIAGLMSNDPAHYHEFYHSIHTGIVHWNKPTTGALSSLPFGGTGFSGNHRPSGYFAADYCAYPVAIQEEPKLTLPTSALPGIIL